MKILQIFGMVGFFLFNTSCFSQVTTAADLKDGDIVVIKSLYSGHFYKVGNKDNPMVYPRAVYKDHNETTKFESNSLFKIIREEDNIGFVSLLTGKKIRVDGTNWRLYADADGQPLNDAEQFLYEDGTYLKNSMSGGYLALTNNNPSTGNVHAKGDKKNPARIQIIKQIQDNQTQKLTTPTTDEAAKTTNEVVKTTLQHLQDFLKNEENSNAATVKELNEFKATLTQMQSNNILKTEIEQQFLPQVQQLIDLKNEGDKMLQDIEKADLVGLKTLVSQANATKKYPESIKIALTNKLTTLITPLETSQDSAALTLAIEALTTININPAHTILQDALKPKLTVWLTSFQGVLDANKLNSDFLQRITEALEKDYAGIYGDLEKIIADAAGKQFQDPVKQKFNETVQKLVTSRPQSDLAEIQKLKTFVSDKIKSSSLLPTGANIEQFTISLAANEKTVVLIQTLSTVAQQQKFEEKITKLKDAITLYLQQ